MAKYIFTILFYLLFAFLISPARAASLGDVVINEIAWMGSSPEGDETTSQAANDEWVELYNASADTISINGWLLKSTDGNPTVELSGSINAGAYFLLSRANDIVSGIPANVVYPYKNNALGNGGEHLELVDNQGGVIDEVNAWGRVLWEGFGGDNDTKHTMERKNSALTGSDPATWGTSILVGGTPKAQNSVYQSGEASPPPSLSPTPEPTPQEEPGQNEPLSEPTATSTSESATNSATSSQTDSQEPLQQIVYPSNIFINELMPSPLGPDAQEEWIEIINESDKKADISSWQIRDTLGAIHTHTFPEGSFVAAHAFLVLSRVTSGITMNNDDDAIELLTPAGEIVQTITYSKAPKGQSYARAETTWKWSSVPTPGSANIIPASPSERGEPQPQKETKKAPIYKAKSTNSENTSVNTRENSKDSKKETPSTTMQDPEANTSPTQTAAIGELAPKTQNTFIYILAPLIALLSAILIFLLKKRLQS